MEFSFVDVILLCSENGHVSVTHVDIFRVASVRIRICL
jgi:hypothetical protein